MTRLLPWADAQFMQRMQTVCAPLIILALSLLSACGFFEADALYKSGSQALERGQYQECIEQLEKAKALVPNLSSFIRNNLGVCYDRVGKNKDAWFEYRRAVINNPQNNPALKNFGAKWDRFKEQGILIIGGSADSIVEQIGEPDFRKKSGNESGEIWGYGNDQMLAIWARRTLEIRDGKVWKIDKSGPDEMGPQSFSQPNVEIAGGSDPEILDAVEGAVAISRELGFYYDASRSAEGRVLVEALWKGRPVTLTMRFFRKQGSLYIASSLRQPGDVSLERGGQKIEQLFYSKLFEETKRRGLQIYGDPTTPP